MPRGIPNNKKTVTASPAAPEPLIILQPDGDNWQFNAYGLDLGDILRALRLTLIHLAAQQAGVVTIEATISARNVVLATPAAPPVARQSSRPKLVNRSAMATGLPALTKTTKTRTSTPKTSPT